MTERFSDRAPWGRVQVQGVCEADVRTMASSCAKARVHFMDNVMFMHNPRLAAIEAALPVSGGTFAELPPPIQCAAAAHRS